MQETSRRTLLAAVAPLACCLGASAWATEALAPAAIERIALSGYDPVSYFTEGRPEKGANDFRFAFDDAVYLFKSAMHRDLFTADPERYAPQYSGFCAAGVSLGYKVEADPGAWKITNGKLFVFYAKHYLAEFEKNPQSVVDKANANWPRLRAQL